MKSNELIGGFVATCGVLTGLGFVLGNMFGESNKHEQWCRATNTELSKFDVWVKRGKP